MRGASVPIQIAAEGSLIHLAIFLHASSKGKVDPAIVSFGSLHKPFSTVIKRLSQAKDPSPKP